MQQFASYVDQILIFTIFGVATNLALGYAGILQASIAAFGAFGGYAVIYLTTVHQWVWLAAVVVGIAAAAAVGLVVGLPALKLDGLWVLLLTLSVGLVITATLSGLTIFGGDNGLQSGQSFSLFGLRLDEPSQLLPLLVVVAVLVWLGGHRIGESAYGRMLRGIRSDESAVASLGKNVFVHKLTVFTLTAGLAGLAGAMLSTLTQVANPSQFSFNASVQCIAIVMIGGIGNLVGTVLGAVIVVLLVPFFEYVIQLTPEVASNIQLIAYGLALTLVVVLRPTGVIPEKASLAHGVKLLAGLARGGRGDAAAATPSAPPARTREVTSHVPRRSGDVVLDVRNVSKAFGGVKAVNGLSMQLEAGTITALVGPNGAGKTTVFNLLTGALPLDGGRVFLRGQDITGLRPDQIAHLGMVRSFQDVRVFPDMTVLDNVQLGVPGQSGEQLGKLFLRPLAARRQERAAREIALRWLGFVGLAELASSRVESLGFGQQKLLALARILATDAQILLLDEPASGIDYQWLDELLGLVSQLRDQGRTVCIVEHNLDVVGRLADHVYFMEVGAVTSEGSFTELTGDPRLAEAYFGAS
jgi:branched-chain amino acid transport system permease protein